MKWVAGILATAAIFSQTFAFAQERLNLDHNKEIIAGIVGNMIDFNAQDASLCDSAEEIVVEVCEIHKSCESNRRSVLELKIGRDFTDDRLIVNDIWFAVTSGEEISPMGEKLLSDMNLDSSVSINRAFYTAASTPSFDAEVARADAKAFQKIFRHHQQCKSRIYGAAQKYKRELAGGVQ